MDANERWSDGVPARLAVVPLTSHLAALPGIEHPSELSFQLKLKEDILDRPLPITDGYLRLADTDAAQVDADLLRSAAVVGSAQSTARASPPPPR